MTRALIRSAMSAPKPTAPMAYLHDGQDCRGFILSRGKLGFEALSRDERPLGIFATQVEAAAAIMQAPHSSR